MSTGRVHTAISALTAQRQILEARLSQVNAALEIENRRPLVKPRGVVTKKKQATHLSAAALTEDIHHGRASVGIVGVTENPTLNNREQHEKHLKKSLVF
jgi:uncharacterized protein YlxP (DUF503 family)